MSLIHFNLERWRMKYCTTRTRCYLERILFDKPIDIIIITQPVQLPFSLKKNLLCQN